MCTRSFCAYIPAHSPLTRSLRSIRDEVAGRIKSLQSQYPRFKPQLAIIQAGTRPDSAVYVRMKAKAAEEVGIQFKHIQVPEEAEVTDIVDIVRKLNDDETVSGILVQLPLGPHIGADGERTVTEAVSPEKDVDGCVFTVPFRVLARVAGCTRAPPSLRMDRVRADSAFSRGPFMSYSHSIVQSACAMQGSARD